MSDFAETLRDAMNAEAQTLAELGQALGLSHTSIARWLRGSLPDDPTLIGRCAACFAGHWPALLVRAYLMDRCPVEYHHLLTEPMVLRDDGPPARQTPLERSLSSIRRACTTNVDMRALVLDLGRLADGL